MQVSDVLRQAQDTITVRRVFTDPYEVDGVTLIAAARVGGGGGGGGGHGDGGEEGEGAGFGMGARPAGVYVVRDGEVRWQPAVDVNRVVATIGAVVIVWLMTRGRTARARLRARAD
jgi:uncharacterized spore protein YtfJ